MPVVVERDIAFHRSIVERAGDGGLTAIWLPIITHMLLPYSRHRSLLESFREHGGILAAIESGDRALAVERLQQNIQWRSEYPWTSTTSFMRRGAASRT